MNLSQLLQQRDRAIYIVAGITVLAVLIWRRLPQSGIWITIRRVLLAWLIAVEWALILAR